MFQDVQTYDIVTFCVQECARKLKSRRADEIETYMDENGFTSISSEFNEMWEMFLLVFVRRELF